MSNTLAMSLCAIVLTVILSSFFLLKGPIWYVRRWLIIAAGTFIIALIQLSRDSTLFGFAMGIVAAWCIHMYFQDRKNFPKR